MEDVTQSSRACVLMQLVAAGDRIQRGGHQVEGAAAVVIEDARPVPAPCLSGQLHAFKRRRRRQAKDIGELSQVLVTVSKPEKQE